MLNSQYDARTDTTLRHNVNILLVEDNPGDARLIAEMLKDTEFANSNLVTTSTLQETLDAPMDPSTVAMVLLDLNLPDSNGILTLERVMLPYTASAIIVLTGLDDQKLALDALRHGAQNYLTKGHIGAEELQRELRYATERHGFVMRLREADRELVDRERRFRSLVEHSSDLTVMVDPKGRVMYASPAVHRIFGHSPIGIGLVELLRPEAPEQLKTIFKEALEYPERAVPLTVRSIIEEDVPRILEGTVTNLLHYNGMSAIVVNLHDVTNRDNAMKEVVSERNDKKALIDSTQDMIWSVGRDFKLITANRWFTQRVKEILDQDVALDGTSIPPVPFGDLDGEIWMGYYERALQGESFVTEAFSEAEQIWGEFAFNPITDSSTITGVACAARNITERKQAEERILQWNAELEQRVSDRTRQLMTTNEELETEIVKNHELANTLAERNQDLMGSINYARHIQNALFPVAGDIPFFSASACLALPRDVVSGDFVWHYETPTHLLLAVADCTGHGVPGALMSMLGHSLLNQMVVERQLTDPAQVLSAMDEAMNQIFTKYTVAEHINDGMDMALVVMEKQTNQLHFAGALIPCCIVRDGHLHRLPGSRSPIGGREWIVSKQFITKQETLRPGDRLVIYTDGFQSQFGGPQDRKLNGPALRKLLERSAALPPTEAAQFLSEEFHAWKGQSDQVDDVLVMILDV